MIDRSCFAVRLKVEEEAISLPILSNHMLTLDQYISDLPPKVLYSQRWTYRVYRVKYLFFNIHISTKSSIKRSYTTNHVVV